MRKETPVHALERLKWFTVSRLVDGLLHLEMWLPLRANGIWTRRSAFTEGDIRKAANTTNPRAFFDAFAGGGATVPITEEVVGVSAGSVGHHRLWFQSPFVSGVGANNTVRASLYRRARPAPLVLILVGTFAERFNSFGLSMAKTIAEKGSDCCWMAVPFSDGRSPAPGTSSFMTADPVATAESFIQAVMDVERLSHILRARFGYREIGLVGVSISGNICHAATFLQPYAGAVLIMAGASPADIVWHARGAYWRRLRRLMGRTHAFREVESLWTMSDATRYTAPNLCPRFLMLNGLYDNLVTPAHARRLNAVIQNCRVIWYPGSHYSSPLFIGPAVENTVRFFRGEPLKDTGLKPKALTAP